MCTHWAWRLVTNKRRPSDRATADRGRTSSTVANSSTSSSRHREAAKRATTRRDNLTYTQSLEAGGGQPLGHQDNACFRKRKSQLHYLDIMRIMDKWLVQQKKDLLMDAEIQKLVTEWQDECGEADLDQATIDREVKTMEENLNKNNVPTLGEAPTQ